MLLPLSASVGNFSHASAATTPLGFRPGQLCMLLHLRWAGILPHEVLADAGGTAAEFSKSWHLASRNSAHYVP